MMHKKINVLVRKSNFIVVLLLFGFCGYGQTVVDATIFKDGIASPNSTINYSANTPITGVLSFNKSEDRWVDLNALQDDLDGASRSIFMWVKSEANVSSEVQMLFAINRADRGNAICNFFIDDYYDNLEIYDGDNTRNATFDMRGEEGEVWNYVGYTYNNTSNETVIYVNGIENLRYTNDQATTATSRFSLGQEFDNVTQESNHFNGDMAEISIWNEVLTGQDIRNSMSTKITNTHAKYANLIAYYSVFGTATDDTTILKDHSNNNNNGIIKSNASWGVDFTNVQTIAGFNAVDWYDTFSWKKNGVEVGSDKEFTTNAAIGNFEFTATKNILQSTNTWAVTESNTATVLDNLMDTTLCIDEAATYSVTSNQVNYLDFEKDNQDYVNVSSITSSLIDTDRSIFMWLKKESNVSSGTSYHLLTIHDASGETAVSRFYIDSSEELGIHTDGTNYSGNTSISSDVWTHVGYTYDAANETTIMYINGNAIRTITGIAMPIASGAIATLGMRFEENGPSRFFDGKMTDITVWDKKLTAEEVTALKANAPANNALNLVAKYGTLQNIADTRVFDATANNHTGYATASSMLVTTAEETIEDYSTSNNDTFSWTKQGVEISTIASASIAPNEGTEAYSVTYGTPFFQKTDDFSLSYTELIPQQSAGKTGGVTGAATFEVDDVDGASYQWFKKMLSGNTVKRADFPFQEEINDVLIVDETLYATTNSGLAYSNDKGSTWTAVPAGVNGFPDTPLVFSLAYANDKIYACTSEGLAVSEDNGQNWTVIATHEGGQLTSLYPKHIFIEGNTIYTAGEGTGAGISISKDNGQTWTNIPMGSKSGLFAETDLIDVAASGDTIFIAGDASNSKLAISRDGGETWNTTITGNGFSGWVKNIAIDGQNVFLTTSIGLAISNDLGVTWRTVDKSQNNFLSQNNTSYVFVENSKIYVIAYFGLEVAISTDNGNTWNKHSFRDYGISDVRCRTMYVKEGNMLFGSVINTTNTIATLFNTSSLSDNSDSAAANQIQGATTRQLTINNLTLEENESEYFVKVTKDGCEQTSDVVTLTVLEVPILESTSPVNQATDIAINQVITYTYKEVVTKGAGDIVIYEYETGTEKQRFSVNDVTINDNELSLSGVSLDNGIKYYVVLEADAVLNSNNNGNLAITDKDEYSFTTICETLVTTQPTNQTGVLGAAATFSVPAVSEATYQWFEGGNNVWDVHSRSRGNGFPNINNVYSVYESNGIIYAATYGGGLAVLQAGASAWEVYDIDDGLPYNGINSVYESNGTIYVGTPVGLGILQAGASTWEVHDTSNGLPSNSIQSVYVSNGAIYVATNGGGLAVLPAGESTWLIHNVANDTGFPNDGIKSVYVSNGTIYVGTIRKGLAVLPAGASDWEVYDTSNGLPNNNVYSVYESDGIIYAGTFGGGLAILPVGASTWEVHDTSNGFPNNQINSVYESNGIIYAGTYAGGLAVLPAGASEWEVHDTSNGFPNNNVKSVYASNGIIYAGTNGGGLAVLTKLSQLENTITDGSDNQISGATTNSLTISNTTLAVNESKYLVKVAKGICEETSDTAMLTVAEESLVNWTGTTNTDWATTANWDSSAVPTATDNVVISNVTRQPIIAASTTAITKDLTLEASASLTLATDAALTVHGNFSSANANALVANSGSSIMVTGTATGDVLYKRNVPTTNWYLITSPVNGESVKDFLTSHTFLTGQGDTPNKNVSFANYKNDGSVWNYYVDGDFDGLNADDTTDLMAQGEGYSIKLATPGAISFSGTMNTSTINTGIITKGINKFNLVGNPFMAYLKLGDFFATNAAESVLSESTTWFWNGSTYETKPALVDGDFKIAPAQAFFVSAGVASVNTTFDISNVTHEGTDTFLKNSDIRPQIKLFMTDGANSRATRLFYIEGTTTGFDNGYDGTLFGGVTQSFALYTHLVSDSVGQKLGVQVLPPSNYENMMVPIGVNASKGTKITFTTESLNLPKGIAVFIEDKQSKTFTRVDEANSSYAVTLAENVNDIGRFFLHTTTSVLSASNINLENVSIYKSDLETLRIVGLSAEKAHLKMYNVLGKQVMSIIFQANGVKDIAVSNLAAGIYIVELETEKGMLNKKIILE